MSSSKAVVMAATAPSKAAKHVSFSTDNKSGAAEAVGESSQSNDREMTSIDQWNEIIDSKVPVVF
jgi:hypothetical protein